jgi:serine/threonine-protein kinase
MRPRANTGSHRPPPPRRTFSSGQRALLWAAGVLGALAIVSAILIVLADRKDSTPVQRTETETVQPSPAPQSAPTGWTEDPLTGKAGGQIGSIRFTAGSVAISALTEPNRNDEKTR